ncbi:TPA: 4-hydroxy-tetrahydrodipicolinate reductase, partial [Serratia marcescens]
MSDTQIRIAIAGAGGRMGRQLIQAVQQAEGVV